MPIFSSLREAPLRSALRVQVRAPPSHPNVLPFGNSAKPTPSQRLDIQRSDSFYVSIWPTEFIMPNHLGFGMLVSRPKVRKGRDDRPRVGLLDLPNEILCMIAESMELLRHISSLCRTNRYLNTVLTPVLYRLDIRRSQCTALRRAIRDGRPRPWVILALEASATVKSYPVLQELLEEMMLHASYWGWIDVIKHLLPRDRTDINKSRSNESPLAKAAYKGHLEIVRLFLDRPDIDPNAKEGENTPLRYAIWGQHAEIVELLLGHPRTDPNVVDYLRRPVLASAAARGLTEIVRLLLNHREIDPNAIDPDLMTPLHWAATSHTKATFELLLAREDVRADARDKRGWTTFIHAARAGCTEIVALLLGLPDVDPNQRDYFGQTALIYAAKEGQTAVVRLLLESNRVDINRTGSGVPDDPELASEGRAILRSQRGDPPPSPFIMTPLAWATFCDCGEIVSMLLERDDIKPNLADPLSNHTPLSLAAQKGYLNLVNLFLQREDVDPDSKDCLGWSPLFHAVAGDYTRRHRTHREVVTLLIEKPGVNINSRDNGGKTPLFIAVECGKEDIVRLLLEKGADVNAMDNRFRRPLDVTSADVHGSLEKLLIAHGAEWRFHSGE